MTPDPRDPILVRRERIRVQASKAQRLGYLLFAVATILFFVGLATTLSGPIVTAIIGLLIGGSIGVGGYLLRSLGALAVLAAIVALLAQAARGVTTGGLPGRLRTAVDVVPGLRALVLAHDRARALDVIAMRHAAGFPAAEALADLGADLVDRRLARGLEHAARAVARGEPLAESLRDAGLVDDGAGHALLGAAEAAGRVDEGLARAAGDAADRLDEIYELAAEWSPRIVYGAVVLWVVGGIL